MVIRALGELTVVTHGASGTLERANGEVTVGTQGVTWSTAATSGELMRWDEVERWSMVYVVEPRRLRTARRECRVNIVSERQILTFVVEPEIGKEMTSTARAALLIGRVMVARTR